LNFAFTRRTLALAAALSLTGCGYHTAGKATKLPQAVHSIAVPTFVNQTHAYRVEQMLTSSVVRELRTRTRYDILLEAAPEADATLRGTVVGIGTSPVTYDAQTGRASSILVTVRMKVDLFDRQGAVLYSNPSYTFREQYQVSREVSSFFEEDTPALERMAHEFARTLVSNILEQY
jgi:outer membrane lipopolysaccharide assembly protein LptE/RlpB